MEMSDEINDKISVALEPAEPELALQIPNDLPLLPLRDIVIYPFMIVPLFVSREKSIRAVDKALGEDRMILLTCQKDLDKEEPQQDDLYKVGTVAVIMRMLKLPDGRIRIHIEPHIVVEPSEHEPHPALVRFAAVLEKYVREYPGQWLLFHRAFCEDAS